MTQQESLPTDVALAFAPLHKRAFGVATAVVGGLLMVLVTILGRLRGGADPSIGLLREYFVGYTVSPAGAVVGFLWGCAVGFVIGWFTAFARNLVLAASIFWIRTRAELTTTRDFLDHI
jgi:hypothetical protein